MAETLQTWHEGEKRPDRNPDARGRRHVQARQAHKRPRAENLPTPRHGIDGQHRREADGGPLPKRRAKIHPPSQAALPILRLIQGEGPRVKFHGI